MHQRMVFHEKGTNICYNIASTKHKHHSSTVFDIRVEVVFCPGCNISITDPANLN